MKELKKQGKEKKQRVTSLTHRCRVHQASFEKQPLQTMKMLRGYNQMSSEKHLTPNLKEIKDFKRNQKCGAHIVQVSITEIHGPQAIKWIHVSEYRDQPYNCWSIDI